MNRLEKIDMNAKEKAEELVEKFIDHVKWHQRRYKFEEAKICALICVDEILKSDLRKSPYDTSNPYDYWKEVKTEIEKL